MLLYDKPFDGCTSKSVQGLPEVYYEPKESIALGMPIKIEPSLGELITYLFITDGVDRYGYYYGLKALHDIHGTTQVPVTIEIMSCRIKEESIYQDKITRYIVHPTDKKITQDSFIYYEILDCIEKMYDYFETDIIECIKYVVHEKQLQKEVFQILGKEYSSRTMEVIDSVFA